MTGPRLDTRTLAVLGAAAALTIGIALIATSGGRARRYGTRPTRAARTHPTRAVRAHPARAALPPAPPPSPPPGDAFAHTPTGAVAAATNWYLRAGQALMNGTLRQTVDALAAPAERWRGLGAWSVYAHVRLTMPGAGPYAVRQWPLGYRVVQYSPTTARVVMWALYVFETSLPGRETGYETNTITVRWLDGTWKFAVMHAGPTLTPPGPAATADQIAAWIRAVEQLKGYSYEP